MIRLFFGLMAVVAVYLGWQWYSDNPAHATGGMFEKADEASEEGSKARLSKAAETDPATQQSKAPTKDPSDASVDGPQGFVAAVLAGDAESTAEAFRRLGTVTGADQEQLGTALTKVLARTDSLPGLLTVLGQGNAFLHSEIGRKAARKTLAKILKLEPEPAVQKMSDLLERCMQGPIAKTDLPAGRLVDEIYRKHKVLVDRVVFSPASLRKCRSYKVKPGDNLGAIARRFRKQGINVEGWTLCYVNRIGRPNRLRAGVTIKIPTEKIWVKIEKRSFLMAVYVGKTIVRLYWVAHGVDDKTPVTTFKVLEKTEDPDWYAPDGKKYPYGHPKNVLGRFFVKFSHSAYQGFGAHGTSEPSSIRTQASLGCIRMLDSDIEEFCRFIPRGAEIVVSDTE